MKIPSEVMIKKFFTTLNAGICFTCEVEMFNYLGRSRQSSNVDFRSTFQSVE